MSGMNGTATASVTAPTAALVVAAAQTEALTQPQNTADIAVFLPAMSIETALARWDSIKQFISRIMTPDEDYGVIPGSKKPSLLKPGAEKLTAFFGLVPTFEVTERIQDWDGERFGDPFFHYEIRCRLSRENVTRGEGLGSCNSREVKYRYRDGERKCPSCGGACIIKSKIEYGGGWLCFQKKGGCGAKYPDGDMRIEAQQLGRIANPDTADLVNTLLKMAKKRAHVDAVLNTVGASQFFAQDLEAETAAAGAPPPPPVTRSTTAGFDDAGSRNIDTGNNPLNSRAAAEYVRDRKITQLRSRSHNANPDPTPKPWKTHGEFLALIALLRERVGEIRYNEELDLAGVESERDFMNRQDVRGALAFYNRLNTIWEAERRLQ